MISNYKYCLISEHHVKEIEEGSDDQEAEPKESDS